VLGILSLRFTGFGNRQFRDLGASVPLTGYLTEGVFDPPAITAITAAYEAVCSSLGLVWTEAIP
jgi:hypothetical protein